LIPSKVAAGGVLLHRSSMTFDHGSVCAANPLHPDRMSAAERRAELCAILARGIVRLRLRDVAQAEPDKEKFRLHFPPDRSGHANPSNRRPA
jgi:hypothetical protein